jgi:probable rRNA maturation factor
VKTARPPRRRSSPSSSERPKNGPGPDRRGNIVSLVVERGPHAGVARGEILRRIHAMIDALQLKKVEVSIVLTDDDRIHELNKIYRHKDRPTDVLAFAMREGDFAALAGDVLGDVIVSVPTARKQAHERAVGVLDEVTMLVAHGLLHLLGWDHDTPAKDRRMRAETDRLCRAAGPAGRSSGRKRLSPARLGGAPEKARPRSKPRADQALSRKRSAHGRPEQGRKVQPPQHVKARRSRKG